MLFPIQHSVDGPALPLIDEPAEDFPPPPPPLPSGESGNCYTFLVCHVTLYFTNEIIHSHCWAAVTDSTCIQPACIIFICKISYLVMYMNMVV